jgi:CheY-like chemotaxis protein
MMPVMDGKTMLRTLRGLPGFEKLPVIILTNAGDIDSIRETKLFGNANAFLIKANVTPQDIVQNIRTYI